MRDMNYKNTNEMRIFDAHREQRTALKHGQFSSL